MISKIVNYSLLLNFLILAGTGVTRFFVPFSLSLSRLHILTGFCLAILVALHLKGKGRYYLRIISQKSERTKKPSSGFLLILTGAWVLFWVVAWNGWPVAEQLINLGYEARNRAHIFRPAPDVARLESAAGLEVAKRTEDDTRLWLDLEWTDDYRELETPVLAVWAESKNGTLIETIFLSEELSFADEVPWGINESNTRRKYILPIWRHRYSIVSGIDPDGEIDLTSGATPKHQFSLRTHLEAKEESFTLYAEVNKSADPNDDWADQPSVIYAVRVNPTDIQSYYLLKLIGHAGGDSTTDGMLNYDLSTLTSGKNFVERILIKVDWLTEESVGEE